MGHDVEAIVQAHARAPAGSWLTAAPAKLCCSSPKEEQRLIVAFCGSQCAQPCRTRGYLCSKSTGLNVLSSINRQSTVSLAKFHAARKVLAWDTSRAAHRSASRTGRPLPANQGRVPFLVVNGQTSAERALQEGPAAPRQLAHANRPSCGWMNAISSLFCTRHEAMEWPNEPDFRPCNADAKTLRA